jgi:integrase
VHNTEVRAREYLTNAEVDRLIKAAVTNRNGHRDATMVLVAYRHGLRPVELVTLRWDAIDFAHGQIHVSRAKSGAPSVQSLSGVELRALRRLKRDQGRAERLVRRWIVEDWSGSPIEAPTALGRQKESRIAVAQPVSPMVAAIFRRQRIRRELSARDQRPVVV